MNKIQSFQYGIKVILDKLISILLLIVLSPLLAVVALLIKLDSQGPVIFKQTRLGKHGKPFTIYKFRTMCDNAENMGQGIYVSRDDYRITRIGRVLRQTSIDELPQLINVLKSEMSLVGPRPPLQNHPYYYSNYDKVQKLRFNILPGITGYAQVYGRNKLSWAERIVMDVEYYHRFSLLFDIKILFATIYSVIYSKGIYSNMDVKGKTKYEKEDIRCY